MDGYMTTGKLAREAGVNVETLRFYERRGLLPRPPRSHSGHRRYEPDALERLRLIKRAQHLGFTLPEVAQLLDAMDGPDAHCRDVCATVTSKIEHIDRVLATLRAQRRRLASLRDACPQEGPLDKCPIVGELVGKSSPRRRASR